MPEDDSATNGQVKTIDKNQTKIDLRYRLCFLGDSGCGKTAMCARFMTRAPPRYPDKTIAIDYKEKSLTTDGGSPVKLMSWDTPGDALSSNANVNHCTRMSIVVFCYDPSKRESYLHVPKWSQEVDDKSPDAIKLMIAVKKDLIDSDTIRSAVPSDEAEEFANSRGMRFFEVNANDIDDVNQILCPIVDEIHNARAPWAGAIQWTPEDGKKKKSQPKTTNGSVPKVSPKGCLCLKSSS